MFTALRLREGKGREGKGRGGEGKRGGEREEERLVIYTYIWPWLSDIQCDGLAFICRVVHCVELNVNL